jgi:hypothetical protein
MSLFPRHTENLTAEDALPRRFAHSLAGMAIITAVLVYSFRLLAFHNGAGRSLLLLSLGVLGQLGLLIAGTTIHLGSHPVHQWKWRAPAFALVESLAAITISAIFISFGVEIIGAEHAGWNDWTTLAFRTVILHTGAIVVFALILGVVVQRVRYAMLKHENRESTAQLIHADHVKQEESAS